MAEFDSHININSVAKAKDTEYCFLKEIEIEHPRLSIETPYKVLEGKDINKTSTENLLKNIKSPIFESWKYILLRQSWKRLYYLLEEAEEDRIQGLDKLIGFRKNLWDSHWTTASFVFSDNPFATKKFQVYENGRFSSIEKLPPLEEGSYDVLLDYIHTVSKALILSPDIRITKDNLDIDTYLDFVDYNVKSLSDFNNKAIFVPIQIHLNRKKIGEILEHYKKCGYVNIWVNFNATHLAGTNFTRVRTLLKVINEIVGLENATLYFSHIKKEVTPHIKDEMAVASNIMPQFFGADFMGIDREPFRYIDRETAEKRKNVSIHVF